MVLFSRRNDKSVTNIMANTHERLKNDFIRLSWEQPRGCS
jgi:hypothetical protein